MTPQSPHRVQHRSASIRWGVVADVMCFCCSVFQLWVQERMAVATSTEHGHNLQTVQLLIKKNQVSPADSS